MSQGTASPKAVKAQLDSDLLESAADEGVDVDAVVASKIEKHQGYEPSTIARFAESEIGNQIEMQRADTVQGIIMGSRDRYGSKAPRRHTLVRSSGDHMQVNTWGGSIPGPEGHEVPIPVGGSAVTVRCSYQEEYDSYDAKGLEAIREMDRPELVEAISQVAIDPSDVTSAMASDYEVVVVRGEIRFVNPQTVFDGDDREDWYDGPVVMEDGSGEPRPHIEISLARDGETSLRGHFERMKNARPYIGVPDLEKLCFDAAREFDKPEDQARFVTDGLQGTEVFLVGVVTSHNTNRGDDDQITHYVDIGLSAIVSADGSSQASLEESATDEEPAPEPEDPQEAAKEPAAAQADEGDSGAAAEAREVIEQYASLVNEDVDDLTFEDVRENIGALDDVPDVAIKKALGEYDEEPEEDEDEESEPESDESGPEDVHGYDDLPFKPEDHTVDEIRDLVKDVDDKAILVNLSTAEEAGKDRKSAGEAIERRAEKIDEEAESDEDEAAEDSDDDAGGSPYELVKDAGTYHCPGTDEDGEDCLVSAGSTGELAAHLLDDHDVSGDPGAWVREQVEG